MTSLLIIQLKRQWVLLKSKIGISDILIDFGFNVHMNYVGRKSIDIFPKKNIYKIYINKMKWSPLILCVLLCGSYAVSMVELSSLHGIEKQRDRFLSNSPRDEAAYSERNSRMVRSIAPVTIGQLNLVPCDPSVIGIDGFHCVNLTVPVDHRNQSGYHIPVSFFIKLAPHPPTTGGRKAIILILGGPGTVIHHRINNYYPILNRYSLTHDHDIIFMEQRCMGWSCGVGCVQSFVDSKLLPLNPDNKEDFAIQMGRLREECDLEILNGQYQSFNGQCMIDGGDLTDPQ